VGQHEVDELPDEERLRAFSKAVLDDLEALEQMLADGRFETGVRRIGAEQEMFLVDEAMLPAAVAPQILARKPDPRLVSELATFNLEANLSPQPYGGRCLSALESELREVIAVARRAARAAGADVVLAGILPTLREGDLTLDKMTPSPRYQALNRAMTRLRGGTFAIDIRGLDHLQFAHDNVMLEGCNTSFQIHLQAGPDELAALYNAAQAAAAPVLAAAVNAPSFLGRRLWQETRVALFERSVDERSVTHQQRGHTPRVTFGNGWVEHGVAEIFREDIARFRMLLSAEHDPPPLEVLAQGGVPKLSALRLHSGTIYRWNRACYGITNGKPHLRIEHRALPAGPSLRDEVANAAFFYGLVAHLHRAHGDVARVMRFDTAKAGFFAAAHDGLGARLGWIDREPRPAAELILEELLPAARRGLADAGFDADEARGYLDVVEARVRSGHTGAAWAWKSAEAMGDGTDAAARDRALVAAMLDRQRRGDPIHTWPLARQAAPPRYDTVGELMSRDLFTVRPDDLAELAVRVMQWQRIRHVPVEDAQGKLVGMVTPQSVIALCGGDHGDARAVRDVMEHDPIAVTTDTATDAALALMRDADASCLPVVDDGKLVGLVTDRDFVRALATRDDR
jgi:CBS domain-containing protein